jgi:hypothetical protein
MPFEALHAVRALFAEYPGRYWIAGGWALDLFADRVRRPHTDVDVLVLARDLDLIAGTFTDPRPTVENPNTGDQRPWNPGETLTPGPDVLAFPDDLFPAPVRIMFAASEGDDWVYHRGRGTVRKPLDEITLTTAESGTTGNWGHPPGSGNRLLRVPRPRGVFPQPPRRTIA